MSEIKGIYAASLSILDENLALNIDKTINHAENLIDQGCHGAAIFGSTGQAQLISVSEKIQLINKLSNSKYRDKYIIGTGLNSLSETINFMKISVSLNFKKFLIMPPAYYKYGDDEVISYYTKIVEQVSDCKIILYNFEKLCGYKFSISCIEDLVKKFPQQIVGVKDSSYNLFENIKIKNFSVLPGSEEKLLKGLKLGCSGIITATCNVTAPLARKVYEDFINNKEQTHNEKLCAVRKAFEEFNLISGLHTFLVQKEKSFKNILPTLSLLNENDKKKLIEDLAKLGFNLKESKAA
jgi:4-hydroxy-tetrahydrodipicolinate synthase